MAVQTNKYVVRIIKFRCGDESGHDRFGSDEPYWVFTANSGGKVNTSRSKVFGDIDSGDTEKFALDSVIWPRKGANAGAPGPIGLTIQLYESDQGNPDDIVKKTKSLFDFAENTPFVGDWVKSVPQVVKDQISDMIADDLMGSKTLLFTERVLTKELPRPGDKFRKKLHIGGNSGDLPFEIAGGPDYYLFIEIERVN